MNQEQLESLYSRVQEYKLVKDFVKSNFEEISDRELDILTKLSIYKTIPINALIESVYTSNNPITDTYSIEQINQYNQETVDIINSLAVDDCLDLYSKNGKIYVRTKLVVPNDIQNIIDLFMYPVPLIEKPKHIHKLTDTGYHHFTEGYVILNLHKEHLPDNYYFCTDILNILSKQKYELNQRAIDHNVYKWRKEINEETMSYKQLAILKQSITNLQKIYKDKEFYLTWKYDKRGRFYDSGYLIHIQGNDYQKSVIQFANKELVQK